MRATTKRAHDSGDYWEIFNDYVVRWRTQRRKALFDPRGVPGAPKESELTDKRLTILSGQPWVTMDDWKCKANSQRIIPGPEWIGKTVFWKKATSSCNTSGGNQAEKDCPNSES